MRGSMHTLKNYGGFCVTPLNVSINYYSYIILCLVSCMNPNFSLLIDMFKLAEKLPSLVSFCHHCALTF